MTTAAKPHEARTDVKGVQFPFEAITDPGTYVSNWSGHLIRIPEEALRLSHSPIVEIRGKEPLVCTKLTDDPFTPINKARMLAADLDLPVHF